MSKQSWYWHMTLADWVFIAVMIAAGLYLAFALGTTPEAHGPQVTIMEPCLDAEDSAAHLILIDYSRESVVYTCAEAGY